MNKLLAYASVSGLTTMIVIAILWNRILIDEMEPSGALESLFWCGVLMLVVSVFVDMLRHLLGGSE
jgi:hypothetical protein